MSDDSNEVEFHLGGSVTCGDSPFERRARLALRRPPDSGLRKQLKPRCPYELVPAATLTGAAQLARSVWIYCSTKKLPVNMLTEQRLPVVDQIMARNGL